MYIIYYIFIITDTSFCIGLSNFIQIELPSAELCHVHFSRWLSMSKAVPANNSTTEVSVSCSHDMNLNL